MSEVIKRDKRVNVLNQLYAKIKRDRDIATPAVVAVWKMQLASDWKSFEAAQDAVLDRAGASELDEQYGIYDAAYSSNYHAKIILAELKQEATEPVVAQPVPDIAGDLTVRHAALGQRLTAICARITGQAEIPLCQIDVQRKAIEQIYTAYQEAGLALIAHGANQAVLLAGEEAIHVVFIEAGGALARSRQQHDNVQRDAAAAAAANNVRDADFLKVPQLTIAPFDGSFAKWEAFRESFTHGIHNRENLPAVQKLQYLKGVLRGEPEELIRNFALTAENYVSAWALLTQRYNNRRELIVSHLRVLTSFSVCKASADDLRSISNTTASTILALSNLGRPTDQWHDWVVFHVCEKLDGETRRMWEQTLVNGDVNPTWAELDVFLQGRIRALSCSVNSTQAAAPSRSQPAKPTKVRAHQTSTVGKQRANDAHSPVRQYVCPCCGNSHLISFCDEFRRLSTADRRRLAAEKSLCFICLAAGHMAHNCTSTRFCQSCNAKHNTLLHHSDNAISEQHVRSNTASCTSAVNPRRRPPVLLATAMVNVRDNAGQLHKVRALLDQGGDASFVSESLAQTLQLTRHKERGEISAIAGVSVGRVNQSMVIQVSDCAGKGFEFEVDAYVLPRVTGELTAIPAIGIERWAHIVDLELADPDFMNPHSVELMLGSDVYGRVLLPGLRQADGLPTSQETQFGWIMSGPIVNHASSPSMPAATKIRIHHSNTDAQLARFWEIEETSSSRHLTADEEKCEAFFEQTVSRDTQGRLHVRLPMKHDSVVFGESQKFAVQRQLQIERRFTTHPEFAASYRQFMRQYIELGHMREVCGAPVDMTRSRAMSPVSCREYYIPHHAVIKEASSTTKLRVVFDASRRTTNGTALNEQMMIGPRLQDDLTAIMMRWRKFRVAFCSDVEKMYRQIIVDEPDTDLQRIVWRSTTDEAMKVYQLRTVTYGTASAPYLAIKSLQTLARLERHNYPLGAEQALNNFYVDDVLGGADTVPNCLEVQAQLIALMSSGGMTLRKWASNCEDVLATVPPGDRECALPLKFDDGSNISTLGVQWSPASDELSFKVDIPGDNDEICCTKRTFLSAAARLFDPLGWLAPCTIVIKIMFQSLWKRNLDWDDNLPCDMMRKWAEIRSSLHQLKAVRIHRWIGTTADCDIELHGFCDASMDAYAAVVYVRVSSANESTAVYNICAKTKVAPIKTISLPRLELCGAALLVKLISDVKSAMQWPTIGVRCWTDSTIVLAWLRGHPSAFNVFVANRTAEIQRTVPVEHWQHVISSDNPADCASRGITPQQLLHHRLWWTGPNWLRAERSEWPQMPQIDEATEEMRMRAHTATVIAQCWPLITQYSSWSRLTRVTAMCMRFIRNCKEKEDSKENRVVGPLRTADLMDARMFWLRTAQAVAYGDELRCLRNENPISKASKLLSLNPVLSADQILCVGGRLLNAIDLAPATRTPAIVPRRSELSALLISDAHHQTLHGGPALMLAYLRRAFWIVDGPNEVRRFVQKCTTCFRYTAKPEHQQMAALPAARVMPSRPFRHCAMDFSGAIMVRSARGRGHHATKAYVAVFVCLSTKAAHIELVGDLTTVGFIAAYERFTARRGCCSDIYSDNATNFVGAAKFLKSERKRFDSTVQTALANKGTTWHFSPPLSPHFNGLAESAIRSVKHHIRRVIGEVTLTFEELTTVLAKIESCLNSRPLCPMSSDPADYDALTPGHFLIGEPLTTVPQRDVQDCQMSALTRWQLTHQIVQRVWKRWSADYLHTLQQRRKWQRPTDNMRVGDMVLLIEDNLPPAKWAIGRVCDVHPGDDGRVRVVTIRAKNSTYTRSVVKVARLPIDAADSTAHTARADDVPADHV